MNTIKKLVKSTFLFITSYAIEKAIFGMLFYFSPNNTDISFLESLYSSFLGTATSIFDNTATYFVIMYALQAITELILFSVFTSYVFAYIVNKEPRIVFPDKLVIRRRTSEGSDGVINLCLMVGNKSRTKIRDVTCTLSCYYVKADDPSKTNGEFKLTVSQPIIHNYYRFSFEVDKLPKKLLKDFITKDILGIKIDRLTFSISGTLNTFGNPFIIEKQYRLDDIVIGENYTDLSYSIKNPFTGKRIFNRIKWKEFKRIEPVDKAYRGSIIKEISEITEL